MKKAKYLAFVSLAAILSTGAFGFERYYVVKTYCELGEEK